MAEGNSIRRDLLNLRLAVYKVFGLVVSMSIPNVKVSQGLTLALCVNDPSVHLSHYSFIVWGSPIRRHNDCTISMTRKVIRSHDVTSRDAEVGGHRRSLNEILGVVERRHALGAAHAAVGDFAVQIAEIHCAPVQAGLRSTVKHFFISVENAVCAGKT